MTEQFKDQVLQDIRRHGVKHTMQVIAGVAGREADEYQNNGVIVQNEWHLIRNMVEAIINGPCDRLERPRVYGNRYDRRFGSMKHRESCVCLRCRGVPVDDDGNPHARGCRCDDHD